MARDVFASQLATRSREERERLDRAIDAALHRAHAAHPDLELDDTAFLHFLADKVPAGADPCASLEALDAGALYLVRAAADGNARAHARLDARLSGLDRTLARFRRDASFVDDVRQRLRERLLVGDAPRILDYGGRGDLDRWLRAVALRIAIDLVRGSERRRNDDDDDALARQAVPDDDPELAHMKQRYGEAFRAAIRSALAELDAPARNSLRLYYLDGLTLEELARAQNVVASTVWRRLASVRTRVLEATRAALRAQLDIGDRDLASVLRLVESRFELPASAFGAEVPPSPDET